MAFTPLNALHSFLAVARRRSLAAAARDLGVSTSALSQSVRQLEARLGVTLLTRTSRTVALTDAGQRLLEHAGPAVEQALESLKTVSARPGEITGRVRLSVPTVAVSLVVARLLPTFLERHPKVEVEVQAENRFVTSSPRASTPGSGCRRRSSATWSRSGSRSRGASSWSRLRRTSRAAGRRSAFVDVARERSVASKQRAR